MSAKMITLFAVSAVVAGILIACKHLLFVNEIPFYWELGLVLVLYLCEAFSTVAIQKKKKTATDRQMVTLYMILKGIRLAIFASVIFIYMLAIKIETKRWILVAAAIYCIFLLINTLMLVSDEKKIKNKSL
ncbi:hypothetical protein AGMMS49525_03970 [Bacteroidia bacterium]|nr:hypothetical protein AGMMS49525_03840 [Bacteroidia bacterium]GHT01886.1 hypothetical protein AGMMS49525_03970 [Bacteroidia bacterium]